MDGPKMRMVWQSYEEHFRQKRLNSRMTQEKYEFLCDKLNDWISEYNRKLMEQ